MKFQSIIIIYLLIIYCLRVTNSKVFNDKKYQIKSEEDEHPLLKYYPSQYIDNINDNNNDITLKITPDNNLLNGDYITISFENHGKINSTSDFIALFAPNSNDIIFSPNNTSPVKYIMCSDIPGYINNGKGQINVRLINLRSPYIIYFMTNGLHNPIGLYKYPNLITFKDYNEPLKIHINTNNLSSDNQLRIIWSQKQCLTQDLIIYYNKNDLNDLTTSTAYSTNCFIDTWKRNDLYGEPATSIGFRNIDDICICILDNLIPNQQYFYQINNKSQYKKNLYFQLI